MNLKEGIRIYNQQIENIEGQISINSGFYLLITPILKSNTITMPICPTWSGAHSQIRSIKKF